MADHHHHHHHDHHGDHDHNHGKNTELSEPGQKPLIDSASFTEANREHWNKYAASYTSEQWQRDLVNQVTAFILANISWIGVDFLEPSSAFETSPNQHNQVRVLDYACGPGTITNALAGRATEYIGIDLSENMVKAYNMRFNPESQSQQDGEGERLNAQAVVGNLLDASGTPLALDDPKYKGFDLVAVGMGYHHFADLPLTTSRLVDRLKPGGVFIIVDFLTHPPFDYEKNHPAIHTIAHHGFNEDGLKQIFEGAGLTDFGMRVWNEKVIMRGLEPREMLLAKGRKP